MAEPNSPAPGTPQTATKAHVAGSVSALATLAAPYVVAEASKYIDPSWAANCLNAHSLSLLGAAGMAAIAGAGTWWATFRARNKPTVP